MRIVSLVAHVPYEGVPHAGGQYVLSHVRALRHLGHDVTLVAPDWRGNVEAARRLRDDMAIDVVVCSPRSTGRFAQWADTQQIRLFPVRPPSRFRRAFARSAAARAAIERADLIEAQWTELGWLSRSARRWNPAARRVVVAHDVIAQTYERLLAAARPGTPAWLLGLWRSHSVRRDEGRLYRSMDAVVVFSEKDAAYVDRLTRGLPRARVLRPSFSLEAVAERAGAPFATPTVLFVGAFFRDVNAKAAEWLIDDIIPRVRARVPGARFVLAGADPTPRMLMAARADPLLEVTGEVPSLEPAYAAATAVVVPLRMGAGLKFKTVEAMLRGIPVVSTTVGAEGLVGEGETAGLTVTDNAEGIAAALERILDDPERAWQTARGARDWARTAFSAETFSARLHDALLKGGTGR